MIYSKFITIDYTLMQINRLRIKKKRMSKALNPEDMA